MLKYPAFTRLKGIKMRRILAFLTSSLIILLMFMLYENRTLKPLIVQPQNHVIAQPQTVLKTKDVLIKEKSEQVYIELKKEVEPFKAQYKKPPECYDMKDDATRIHCANEFIRARKAYEALSSK
jgi:hypothetical protein